MVHSTSFNEILNRAQHKIIKVTRQPSPSRTFIRNFWLHQSVGLLAHFDSITNGFQRQELWEDERPRIRVHFVSKQSFHWFELIKSQDRKWQAIRLIARLSKRFVFPFVPQWMIRLDWIVAVAVVNLSMLISCSTNDSIIYSGAVNPLTDSPPIFTWRLSISSTLSLSSLSSSSSRKRERKTLKNQQFHGDMSKTICAQTY